MNFLFIFLFKISLLGSIKAQFGLTKWITGKVSSEKIVYAISNVDENCLSILKKVRLVKYFFK